LIDKEILRSLTLAQNDTSRIFSDTKLMQFTVSIDQKAKRAIMTANATPTKRLASRRVRAMLLLLIPLVLCLSAALWIEFAPHYLSLEKVDVLGAGDWSPTTTKLITRNGLRVSIWSGESTICASQTDLCQGQNQAEVAQQLTDWFTQHGWEAIQRNPTTGWNVCDNMGIVQERSDLILEQQSGWYYKPSACIVIEPDTATSGFTIYATTINPSPLTSWSD
jgi:hypothetical protein